MKLEEVFRELPLLEQRGDFSGEITGLRYRSAEVVPGDLFVAWQGEKVDGHDYVEDAWARGASAFLTEKALPQHIDCPWARVQSSRQGLALAAANFYGRPAQSLTMVGITGTNGKTSIATLLHDVLEKSGIRSGLLGTVEYRVGEQRLEAQRTTPESLDLQRHFFQMQEAGCQAVVMEVSSHALALDRTCGVPFQVAIFTNLTRDHLDFHQDMEAYFRAKQKLFTGLRKGAVAVINVDDVWGRRLLGELPQGVKALTYSLKEEADFRAENLRCDDRGLAFDCVEKAASTFISIPWLGLFNASNVLAVIAAARFLGLSMEELAQWLPLAPGVPGRLERVGQSGEKDFQVLVDYAHTDDAVRNILQCLRPLCRGHLKILLGCGGNRDQAKRPLMARAACSMADEVVFTSDNPRHENPEDILRDMVAGVADYQNYQVVSDRKKAIEWLIDSAGSGDVLVLAGKGHETTQEVAGVKTLFSDRVEATQVLRQKGLIS
jgi:UDP-N-acetylmuramoyl-L-alanyl-D-glutamate--2,6-diaminopimelate ligase